MNVAVVGGERGQLDRGKRAESAEMRPQVVMAGPLVVVEASSLGKGLPALITDVRFVTGVHPGVSLKGGGLAKCLSANFTAVRSLTVVFPTVAEHGGLVTEPFVAHTALERFFARVLAEMIVEVHPCFEGLVARGTGKIPNVFVV